MNINDEKDNSIIKKISVDDYIADKSLLHLTYIPFDNKMEIISQIINGVIKSVGGLNSSLLRRISIEIIIESISNIDMNAINKSGLKGFDELLYRSELNNLVELLGDEYMEFNRILNERISDYIRIETNPAITIEKIYEQLKTYISSTLDYMTSKIQEIDLEEFADAISSINYNKEGE